MSFRVKREISFRLAVADIMEISPRFACRNDKQPCFDRSNSFCWYDAPTIFCPFAQELAYTFTVGFGFFGISIIWPIFNSLIRHRCCKIWVWRRQ